MARSGVGQRAWLPPQRCLPSPRRWLTLATLLSAAALSRAQSQTGPTVPVGAVGFKPVSIVNPKEFDDSWYFWVIIAVVAAFFVVGSFFVWRGVRQWRLHKRQAAAQEALDAEQAETEGEDGERAPAAPTAPASAPPPLTTNGQQQRQQRDVELGNLAPAGPAGTSVTAAAAAAAAPVVPVVPAAAAAPTPAVVVAVSAEQAAWQRATASLFQDEAWLRERERRTGVRPSRNRW